MQITEEEYNRLCDRDNKLTALENGGVDNWEWYSDSLESYFKEKELEEKMKKYEELISNLYIDITESLIDGIYEPSERGAGYAISSESEKDIKLNLKEFIKNIIEID